VKLRSPNRRKGVILSLNAVPAFVRDLLRGNMGKKAIMVNHFAWVFLSVIFQAGAMNDSAQAPGVVRGNVDIVFNDRTFMYSFSLDKFKPEGDSCAQVIVKFPRISGAWACFLYTGEKRWQFENIGYLDSSGRCAGIRVRTTFDENGYFYKAKIIVGSEVDTLSKIELNTTRKGDVPAHQPPPPLPFDFSFERKAANCGPETKATVIVRKFTYPARYMRRDPMGLNYPELAMFHYGGAVHLPSPISVHERGVLINYWHILHPDPMEYGGERK
jgi:hypothetical protein